VRKATAAVFDLAVVGAGPAGIAAAVQGTALGLDCVLLDEQHAPGGQIFRNVERAARGPAAGALGASYRKGAALAGALRDSSVDYRPGAVVWHVETDAEPFAVWYLRDDRVNQVRARRVVLAGGALERPVPVPGWTLPGVMTVGALQILLKSAAMTPLLPTVLVGSGPLIYLTAVQHAAAGGEIAAVLLTGAPPNRAAAVRHLPGFAASGTFPAGLRLLRAFRALGCRMVRDVAEVRIVGENHASGVRYRTGGGATGEVAARLVGLHEGVIPDTNLARSLECEHVWDEGQQAFRPVLDRWANSTVEGVQIAGDGGGIAGADACAPAGRIAALEAARALGRISEAERDRRAGAPLRALRRALRARPFLDALYAPRLAAARLADETVICRCEEVTAGDVRQAVAAGAQGPNQTKAFLRCGMGPCQGRLCGATVSRLIAEARGVPVAEVGYFRLRPPVKPVPLRSFASVHEGVA
jgi:NADPH-dependent 2,4-dienoyl-CoA reductase/sulfur reductase-like enzyme